METEKKKLRAGMREDRKKLAQREPFRAIEQAKQAAQHLFNSDFYKNSFNVACYLAVNGEIETQSIIRQLWEEGKRCYIPVINPDQSGTLLFSLYLPEAHLIKNKHHIFEPEIHSEYLLSPERLDLVVLPLTAFDPKGNRLGMGGGYYDRTFAFKKLCERGSRPWLCGLAYAFQQVPTLPVESWDVSLDAMVTEKKLWLRGDGEEDLGLRIED